jgi:hypothetical protein
MRIGAYKSADFLEFTPLPEISSSSFDFVASVEGRQISVSSLALLSTKSFLHDLALLRARWTGTATLTGTYDFCLQIRALKPEKLWLSIYAVDYISTIKTGDLPCCRLMLDAGFYLQDSAAIRLFDQFDELLRE